MGRVSSLIQPRLTRVAPTIVREITQDRSRWFRDDVRRLLPSRRRRFRDLLSRFMLAFTLGDLTRQSKPAPEHQSLLLCTDYADYTRVAKILHSSLTPPPFWRLPQATYPATFDLARRSNEGSGACRRHRGNRRGLLDVLFMSRRRRSRIGSGKVVLLRWLRKDGRFGVPVYPLMFTEG